MSSFSSWGAGPALELKPEITAPGGNIWSAVIDTTYYPANPGGIYDDYDPATKTLTFTCDVTEYAHTNESYPGESGTYTFEWDGTIFLSCGDYGLNDRTYVMKVDTGSGIRLSQTSALMYVGGEFELSVLDNTGAEGDLVRTSSNEDVATIDEYGKIKAIAPGHQPGPAGHHADAPGFHEQVM